MIRGRGFPNFRTWGMIVYKKVQLKSTLTSTALATADLAGFLGFLTWTWTGVASSTCTCTGDVERSPLSMVITTCKQQTSQKSVITICYTEKHCNIWTKFRSTWQTYNNYFTINLGKESVLTLQFGKHSIYANSCWKTLEFGQVAYHT